MVRIEWLRLLKHLCFPPWRSKTLFPANACSAIKQAIQASERTHSGEVRFVVEGFLDWWKILRGISARERALEVFSEMRIWDTEHNNGALIYILLADRKVEIVADRGIAARVSNSEWGRICRVMEQAFADGDFAKGAVQGIEMTAQKIAAFFPANLNDQNELPDAPVIR